jgi:hypothetical protein
VQSPEKLQAFVAWLLEQQVSAEEEDSWVLQMAKPLVPGLLQLAPSDPAELDAFLRKTALVALGLRSDDAPVVGVYDLVPLAGDQPEQEGGVWRAARLELG